MKYGRLPVVPTRKHWRKGETSGHTQHVVSVRLDCDGDTVLLEVDQVGALVFAEGGDGGIPLCHLSAQGVEVAFALEVGQQREIGQIADEHAGGSLRSEG